MKSAVFLKLPFLASSLNKFYTWWSIDKPNNLYNAEYCNWEVNAKMSAPIRYWIQDDLTQFISKYLVRPFIDTYYWLNYRFNPDYQLHIIKPRTLKPGLHSASDRILHANMEILRTFYESQDPKDYTETDEMSFAWEQFTEMYNWWKNYQNREIILPDMPTRPDGWTFGMIFLDEYKDSEYAKELLRISEIWRTQFAEWEKEERTYLIRLMNLRNYLIV